MRSPRYFGQNTCIIGVVRGEVAVGPASTVFKCLREIPVIDGAERANVGLEESVREATIVVDAFWIDRPGAGGLDACPGGREAIAFLVEALEDGYVLFVAVVLIAGDVAGGAAFYFADGVGEAVPDGFALAVLVPCAFDLIGGGGHAPEESFGEACGVDLRCGNLAGDVLRCALRICSLEAIEQDGARGGEGVLHEIATVHGMALVDRVMLNRFFSDSQTLSPLLPRICEEGASLFHVILERSDPMNRFSGRLRYRTLTCEDKKEFKSGSLNPLLLFSKSVVLVVAVVAPFAARSVDDGGEFLSGCCESTAVAVT